MSIVSDQSAYPPDLPETVLDRVLRTYGVLCKCRGACGMTHRCIGGACESQGSGREPLIVAPVLVPATEHEAAAVPVEELRPWCVPCWRKARKRAAEMAAERRRQELAEAQTALPVELFGGGGR